ncbi:hypothetical protein V1525DRAFT_391534 [Lipomyces kononenkoae]|uniref:Uncharacterized protein n=1 Tax=Lipomyces kononenkoae TaxID=34357 RepID=A0ACC3SRW3_LIPKO
MTNVGEEVTTFASGIQSIRDAFSKRDVSVTSDRLLDILNSRLESFCKLEDDITQPTLTLVRNALESWTLRRDMSPRAVLRLSGQLHEYSSTLDDAVELHTNTLSDIKRFEDESHAEKVSIQLRAAKVKRKAKVKMVAGPIVTSAIVVLGLPLAPLAPTAVNLVWKVGARVGLKLIASGEKCMEEYQATKVVMSAIDNFSETLRTVIDVLKELVGLLALLSDDIERLSATKTKLEVFVICKKAEVIMSKLVSYTALAKDFTEILRQLNTSSTGCLR